MFPDPLSSLFFSLSNRNTRSMTISAILQFKNDYYFIIISPGLFRIKWSKNEKDNSIHNLRSCFDWMYKNNFKLNRNKTELLLIDNKCHRVEFKSCFPIDILSNNIPPTPSARNMGVSDIFDFWYQVYPSPHSRI